MNLFQRMRHWRPMDWEAFAFGCVYIAINVAIIAWFARHSYDLGAFAALGMCPR